MKKFIIDEIRSRLLSKCKRLQVNCDNIIELPDGRFAIEFDDINIEYDKLPKNIEIIDELPI